MPREGKTERETGGSRSAPWKDRGLERGSVAVITRLLCGSPSYDEVRGEPGLKPGRLAQTFPTEQGEEKNVTRCG